MAVINPVTTGSRHVLGDLVFRLFTVGNVNNGDTLQVPLARVESVVINAVATGADPQVSTFAPGPGDAYTTLTFVSGSAWSGRVGVFARLG